MLDIEVYLRRSSKRLSQSIKSVQVYDGDRLVAVLMNRDRYLSAVYSQNVKARRRVYRKTNDALSIRTVAITLPERFTPEDVRSFLAKDADLGKGAHFPAIFFDRSPYGKVSVCISPRSFRLLRKTSSIKMSCNKLNSYIGELPLRRKSGELTISGISREI